MIARTSFISVLWNLWTIFKYLHYLQGFVFCALLEFALVNYASRSDIQRERSRERMERARRQWELENADSMDPSSNSLSRQNKVPSYEATVLHMVRHMLTTKISPLAYKIILFSILPSKDKHCHPSFSLYKKNCLITCQQIKKFPR